MNSLEVVEEQGSTYVDYPELVMATYLVNKFLFPSFWKRVVAYGMRGGGYSDGR